MSDSFSPPVAVTPPGQANTLRFQSSVNRLVRGLLRTPLISRGIGRHLITIYVVGRRSGRHFAVPVAYTREGGRLLIGSQARWLRNLHSGDPVEIRLAGRRQLVAVEMVSGEAGVVQHLASMALDNHHFAEFNRIGFDERGRPLPADLRQAWTAGMRVVLLTPS